MLPEETTLLCRLLAQVVEYPGPSLPETATQCLQQLEKAVPDAAGPMREFVAWVQSERQGALEELYTRTFDTTPATTLYVGYHLFGESPKRSTFLVRLQEAYQAYDFSCGTELPDHLCVILRFLSVARDAEFVTPLLEECVLPALEKIQKAFREKNRYEPLIRALSVFLRQAHRQAVRAGGAR